MCAASADPYVSQLLGERFEVRRPLAEGGMARVYVATDRTTGEDVALKILAPPKDDAPLKLERMRREANALLGLDHPNIVKTHDHGPTPDGGWFIAMELVDGPSVSTWVREQKPRTADVLQVLLQVCSALRHAHRKGIVHRDLKASNLLVARDERGAARVKLIDFGVVQVAGEDTLSGNKDILGSVHTIAPEQVKGEPIDHRADIYSLGVLAYRLLSGVYPYHSKVSAEVISRHVHAPVPVLDPELGLPKGLPEIVARCMAKAPDDRYADVQQLMDELSECLEVPTSLFVRPVQAAAGAVTDPPASAAAFAVVGLVVLVLLVVSWVLI